MRSKRLMTWLLAAGLAVGLGGSLAGARAAVKDGDREKTIKTPAAKFAPRELKASPKPQISRCVGFAVSPPLGSLASAYAEAAPVQPGTDPVREIENEDYDPYGVALDSAKGAKARPDAALDRTLAPEAMPATTANFEGLAQSDNFAVLGGGVYPPDTNGAVGPNHFVQTVNLLARVYDKTGVPLTVRFPISSLFTALGAPCGTRNDGDPIVLYDRLADRWLISQFVVPSGGPFFQEIAISQTGDPTGSYYLYCFQLSTTIFNDYPKISVWPDGYYMTINEFNSAGTAYLGVGAIAFERTKMLAGDPTAKFVYFDLGSTIPSAYSMLPSDIDGNNPPPAGAPAVFGYINSVIGGFPSDAIALYNFHVDWAVPANSTFTVRSESPVAVSAFDPRNPSGRADIPQPACVPPPAGCIQRNLDSIGGRLMYRLAYRNFGTYETLVTNMSVDALAWPSYRSAVRWFILKSASVGGTYSKFDDGTYSPDTDHRWMGSAGQDNQGNLALVYSVSSTATFPGIRFAGRLTSDPAGTLGQGEATLIAGTGVQRGTANRWGDYSSMQIDPADDATFWFTTEYYTAAGQALSSAGWQTRVGAFKFPGVPVAPSGALHVNVTNCNNGDPVSGASVTTQLGHFRSSDGAGLAAFGILAPGSYTVTVTKPGWLTNTGTVTVTNGGTATLNVCITPIPVIVADTATLTAESCVPGNGVIDPNELVTVNFCIKNAGAADSTNLVATLQNAGGVVLASAPVTYGVVTAGGAAVCGSFTFAADHTLACGSTLTATIAFQDGALNLGTQSWNFTLGIKNTYAPVVTANATALTIPTQGAATPYPSPIVISGQTRLIDKVTVTVSGFSHTFTSDVSFLLVGPAGQKVMLMQGAGGSSNVSGVNLTFDDAAAGYVPTVMVSGTYKPTQLGATLTFPAPAPGAPYASALSAFQGSNPNGTWNLFVLDGYAGDGGGISGGWSLSFTTYDYSCCVCPPIAIAPSPLPPAVVGLPYSQTLTASGTAGPYTYAVTAGALPTGLTLTASGILSGTPTSNATFNFTVTATDAAGCSGSQAYTMAPANLFFLDDAGRSKFCANAKTGAYIWVILTGPGAGTYSGTANVLNGGAKVVSKPGATNILNVTYDPVRKKATGYFIAGGAYSPLSDTNTANNTGGCP
jgi:subtilisin-like proprotein convertase family protein